MNNGNIVSIFSYKSYESFEGTASCSSSMFYANDFHESTAILRDLNRYDQASEKFLKCNKELRSFILYSLALLKAEKIMFHVALEHVSIDEGDKIRMIFHVEHTTKHLIFKEQNMVAKREIYDDLIDNLFYRNKELRKMMVLDERVL